MPSIQKKVAVLANGTATPFAGEQYEYLPFDCQVEIAVMADATGVLATVYSGSDLLQDEGAVPFSAAAPRYPDDYLLRDVAAAGEKLTVKLRDTSGVNRTVFVFAQLTPI